MSKQEEILFEPIEKPTKLVAGGIYISKEDDLNDIYDGMFGLCMGNNGFYFLFDGMDHIENIMEIASAHTMRIVEGYCLAINKREKMWSIKNSALPPEKRYLASGHYSEGFEESLKPFFKVFMK